MLEGLRIVFGFRRQVHEVWFRPVRSRCFSGACLCCLLQVVAASAGKVERRSAARKTTPNGQRVVFAHYPSVLTLMFSVDAARQRCAISMQYGVVGDYPSGVAPKSG
ncbi:hypothetical protein C3Z06_25250 [Cupriavidus metallidurans]|nr:hypothetical protein C3Z06_25250 [Cupriavidus metallidurans]